MNKSYHQKWMSDIETISKLITKIKFLKKEKKNEIKSRFIIKKIKSIFSFHRLETCYCILRYYYYFFGSCFFLSEYLCIVYGIWIKCCTHAITPCPSQFFFYHFYTLIFTLFIYFYFNGWNLKFLFSILNLRPSQLLHQVQYLISIIVFV